MAAVTVTFDGARVDAADAAGNWTTLDAKKVPDVNLDFFYQGTGSISRKIDETAVDGVQLNPWASVVDVTSPVRLVIFKMKYTTIGILELRGPDGASIRIGSDEIDYYTWFIHGRDTYPPTSPWLFIAIDPNVALWRDAVLGTPTLSIVDYSALQARNVSSSRDDCLFADAIDHMVGGTGLTLVGGDGGDADGLFDDFVDEDEGTNDNRWGVVSTREGVLYVQAVLQIGNGTATVFRATGAVVVFVPGLIDEGQLGVVLGIGNASSDLDLDDCVLLGVGKPASKRFFDNIGSVDAANNEIDIPGHGFETGDPVLYSIEGGSNAVGGLTDDTIYFVKKITDDAFALSDSRYAAQVGDIRLVLADASLFVLGGDITGDGDNGNTGVGIVVAINGNDVTVRTLSGAWVSGNGVDNFEPFGADDTTISSIESTNGGLGLSDGASGENHSLQRQPDTRPDFSVTISMTLASSTGFVVGGPITGDGDNGNDGVGIVRGISGAVVEVETLSGSWVATNGVDNADPYSADQTTISSFVASGACDQTGGSCDNFRRFTLFAGVTLRGILVNCGKILLNGGALDGATISDQTTEEGEALIETDTLADLTGCDVEAGVEGHWIKLSATGTFGFVGNIISAFWAPATNGWNFHTQTGVDASTEVITTDAAHGFVDGEAVYYNDEGLSDTVGLTDLQKYYVNSITSTTLSLHRSRENAIADTNRINLSDGAAGQTHSLYSGRATIFNDSGGSITINVTSGGSTPSIRNGAGASTTVNNTVTLTVSVKDAEGAAIEGARVRIEEDPGGTLVAEGSTNASGVFTDTSFNFLGDQDVQVIVRLKKYVFFAGLATILSAGLSVPVTLQNDTVVELP